jgi:hypothetical protein
MTELKKMTEFKRENERRQLRLIHSGGSKFTATFVRLGLRVSNASGTKTNPLM